MDAQTPIAGATRRSPFVELVVDETDPTAVAALHRRIDRIEEMLMSAQDKIDAAASAMTEAAAELLTAANGIQAQQAAGEQVDTSALEAAVPQLQAAVAGISALSNPAPAAPADPAPADPAPADPAAS